MDLSGRGLSSLAQIGVQEDLQVLILSNNDLKSFASLKLQPNLTTIIADNNPILYLNGLKAQPSLHTLDLTNTPLSKKQSFRVITLATVGPNLLVLNGKKLTRQDQQVADIFAKRKSSKLFIGDEDEDDADDQENGENDLLFHAIYSKEHQQYFGTFAMNEAILYDLQNNGPMPYIDETSSEDDLAKAIENIRKRIEKLRLTIQNMGGEL